MDYLEQLDTTQKILLGLVVIVLVILMGYYFMGDKTVDSKAPHRLEARMVRPQMESHQQQPQQMQMEPQQDQQAPQGRGGVLVLFFAPWCGHCKNVKPAWAELTSRFDGLNGARIVEVNADENQQLTQLHGVKGFPTIKYCPLGLDQPESVEYQGDRSVQSMAEFLNSVSSA